MDKESVKRVTDSYNRLVEQRKVMAEQKARYETLEKKG